MASEKSKKFAIIGVSSVVLVAVVVALIASIGWDDENQKEVAASQRSIASICQSTDYQETCVNSLSSAAGNTSDPKDLIKIAFEVTMKKIEEAANHSSVLQELHKDPRTNEALKSCQELANLALKDLQRSFETMEDFELSQFDDVLAQLKIWLSGAMTYEETCLDGFQDTVGDAGEKMRDALKTAMELTTNSLAMIDEICSALQSLNIQTGTNRRLLSTSGYIWDKLGDFVDRIGNGNGRGLLMSLTNPKEIKANLTVAKDGTGKYKTINEALFDIPKKSNKTFVLYIKEGIYNERVQFNSSLTHLMVIGDGPTKTRITGSLNYKDGTTTYHTATVAVLGDYFIAKDIGFENTAGPEKHQAVALRVGADMSMFYNCHMDGYQDTLYTHTYRQFYRDCVISGTIDFIFGDAAAVFQNCTMVVRKPMDNQKCIVTAQGRKNLRQPSGLVLQNCTFVADPAYYPVRNKIKSYLGRPWKEYSRTIIMESYIDDLIQPEGWLPWNETFALDTLFYTEFNNRGPSSPKEKRVQWQGIKELPMERVQRFTAAEFIEGDDWILATGVPYTPGFVYPPPKENATSITRYTPEEDIDVIGKKNKSLYPDKPAVVPSNNGAPPSSPGSSNNGAPPSSPGSSNNGAPPSSPGSGNNGALPSSPGSSNNGAGSSNNGAPPSSPGSSNNGAPPSSPGSSNNGALPSSPGSSNNGAPPSSPGSSNNGAPPSSPGSSNNGAPPSSPGSSNNGAGSSNNGALPSSPSSSNNGAPPSSSGSSNAKAAGTMPPVSYIAAPAASPALSPGASPSEPARTWSFNLLF